MKVHFSLIIRTFIDMAAPSRWSITLRNSLRPKQPIPFHSTSTLANPQNSRFYSEWRLATEELKRKYKGSSEYNEDKSSGKNGPSSTDSEYTNNDAGKNFPSVTADCVVKDGREYNNDEDESLRVSTEIPRPRPQEVPLQKATVDFMGRICQPVHFEHIQSGEAFACTSLELKTISREYIRFALEFWNALAETAAWHLKVNDSVYVSGFLGLRTTADEDDKLHIYKVTATTLKFVERRSPNFFQQAVVNNNTSSNSGKNAEDAAAIIENLWQAFFNSPLEWWDNRANKRNPRIPDFRHKDTGEALWIKDSLNPSWVKFQLDELDSRMKVSEECGRGGSSARSLGSLSSSQDSGF